MVTCTYVVRAAAAGQVEWSYARTTTMYIIYGTRVYKVGAQNPPY